MKRPGLLSVLVLALGLAACANTIKGAGRDTANAVDATKQAGEEVAEAIEQTSIRQAPAQQAGSVQTAPSRGTFFRSSR